nr:unnamed protein product [Callosobruchus analis]
MQLRHYLYIIIYWRRFQFQTFTQGSMDSQLDAASLTGSKLSGWQERKSSLTRSQTDSNITYAGEELQEAPGSGRYITKDGDIDLQVVLQAVHRTAMRESTSCTLRVLEVILNLVELLLDMSILKQCLRDEALANIFTSKQDVKYPGTSKVSPGSTGDTPHGSDGGRGEKLISPHRLMMNIIVRALKHLGCPHGCMDGQRGPAAEFLRTQCQNIFSKLHRASGKMLKNYLRDFVKYQSMNDILDFFHAYLGYCVDPSSLLSPLSKNNVGILEFGYDIVFTQECEMIIFLCINPVHVTIANGTKSLRYCVLFSQFLAEPRENFLVPLPSFLIATRCHKKSKIGYTTLYRYDILVL